MKKRNKEYLKEKKYLSIKRAIDDNYDAQRNLGYIKLDVPIKDGYVAYLTLRYDISNRTDAEVFQYIVDNFGSKTYAKKIKYLDFFSKDYFVKKHIYTKPHIRDINSDKFNSLKPCIQKYFTPYYNNYNTLWYYCNIPNFYFEIAFDEHFKDKVRVMDEILLQEYDDLEKELKTYEDNYGFDYFHFGRHVPKKFRKCLNVGRRRKNKMLLKNDYLNEDIIFDDTYNDANWRYF